MTTPTQAKTYKCQLEVRGYELDSYRHVNNAQYISYLEHARWELLKSEGITLATLDEWKRWPVVAGLEVKYLKPTFMGDILEIRTHLLEHERSHIKLAQQIYRGDTLVVDAKVHAVIVNEKGRPDEVPPQMRAIWESKT